MKSLLFFALGVLVGGAVYHFLALNAPPSALDGRTTAERAREGMRTVGERVGTKLSDWNLSGESIREELAETGRVVREKAQVAGARIDDARIVSVIKAKYVLERNLKALAINVDAREGHVHLVGEVATEEAFGRAVALALETDGVVKVDAELKVVAATAAE